MHQDNSAGPVALLAAAITAVIVAVTVTVTGGAGTRMADVPRPLAALTPNQHALVKWAVHYGPRSGIRYVWGGSSRYGFDCSGFAWYITHLRGFNIPRTSRDQFYSSSGTHVPKGQERPGDIVFFHGYTGGANSGPPPGHVGVYIGHGTVIDYYRTGLPARYSRLSDHRDYMGAKRWWHPVRVQVRVYNVATWAARRFHVKISWSHGYNMVQFVPRRHKLVRWAKSQHLKVRGNANHTNIWLRS